jgi:serine/threonine-protein kinase
VKVLDFGVAKLREEDAQGGGGSPFVTGTGAMLGTPSYMAPEQGMADTEIDARADVWALGVMLYECLAGRRPLEGSSIGSILVKLVTDGIHPLDQRIAGVPPAIANLVMRMLATKREERLEDLAEVRNALLPIVDPTSMSGGVPHTPSETRLGAGEEPVGSVPVQRAPPQMTTPAIRRRLYVLGAVAVVSLLLLTAYRAPRSRAPEGATTSNAAAAAQRPSQILAGPGLSSGSPPPSTASEGSATLAVEHHAPEINERIPSDPPAVASSVVAARARHKPMPPSEALSRTEAPPPRAQPSVAPGPPPEPFRGEVVKTPPF